MIARLDHEGGGGVVEINRVARPLSSSKLTTVPKSHTTVEWRAPILVLKIDVAEACDSFMLTQRTS